MEEFPCACSHGQGHKGGGCTRSEEKCEACDFGYRLDEEFYRCKRNECACEHGTKRDLCDYDEATGVQQCKACDPGFYLRSSGKETPTSLSTHSCEPVSECNVSSSHDSAGPSPVMCQCKDEKGTKNMCM